MLLGHIPHPLSHPSLARPPAQQPSPQLQESLHVAAAAATHEADYAFAAFAAANGTSGTFGLICDGNQGSHDERRAVIF